jgi:hypothetical protein
VHDQLPTDAFQADVLVKIVLIPVEEEDDDLETLSTIEGVRADLWTEVSSLEGYATRITSDQTRDAGVLLILSEIARDMIAQKDLVLALFQAGVAVIGALAKHGLVKRIEMTLDGDSISVEEANQATVQKLIEIFEARHPGKLNTLTSASPIQVVGTISKRKTQSGK